MTRPRIDEAGSDSRGRLHEHVAGKHAQDCSTCEEEYGLASCRCCHEIYSIGGDGWDGLCGNCADRRSAQLD